MLFFLNGKKGVGKFKKINFNQKNTNMKTIKFRNMCVKLVQCFLMGKKKGGGALLNKSKTLFDLL
jgi:hypothetical protein